MKQNRFLTAALAYAADNLAIFPCKPGGKDPLTKRGFRDATTDTDQIRQWWGRWPKANPGLPMAMNGLLCLDIDVAEGKPGAETWAALVGSRDEPVTWEQISGRGGRHFIFRLPEYETIGELTRTGPDGKSVSLGIDLRRHAYIVVYTAVYVGDDAVDGGRYRWVNTPRTTALADVPDWLEPHIRRPEPARAAATTAPAHRPADAPADEYGRAQRYLAAIPNVARGGRDNAVFTAACKVVERFELGEADVLDLMLEWDSRNDPPLESDQRGLVERKVRSALARTSYDPTLARPTVAPEPRRAADRPVADQPPREQQQAALRAVEPDQEDGRPVVVVTGRGNDELVDEGRGALEAAEADQPSVFLRSGILVEVIPDEAGWPTVRQLNIDALRDRFARAARWVKLAKTKDGWAESATSPARDVVSSALARPELWQVPPLAAVIQVPTIRPDGSLLLAPGYDRATKLYYSPPHGLTLADVPAWPTQQQAQAAMQRVATIFADFPFVAEADKANTIALLLTPVVRGAIDGPTPLGTIDAPQPGTGKSLIAEVIFLVATGQANFASAPHVGEEPEWRKQITTMLAAGNTVIGFDNIEDVLRSAELARAITAPIWVDRILGGNTQIRVPVKVTWVATGNNIRVGGDLARRCYRIQIDAQSAEPWERKDFAIPNLRGYVMQHRGQILADLLTIARAWFAAGQPEAPDLPTLGSFEEWRRIIGGMLHYAGVAGFLANLRDLYEDADPDAGAWHGFLAAWQAVFADIPVTTKQVADAVDEVTRRTGERQPYRGFESPAEKLAQQRQEALAESIPGYLLQASGLVNRKSMGRQLDKIAGRRYLPRNIRLERAGRNDHTKNARWVVVVDTEQAFAPDRNTAATNPLPERDSDDSAVFAVFPPNSALGDENGDHDSRIGGLGKTPQNTANTATDVRSDDDTDPWGDQ